MTIIRFMSTPPAFYFKNVLKIVESVINFYFRSDKFMVNFLQSKLP